MSVTLGVIALQLAAGYINSKRQCKLSSDVAAAQQAFEEKATREGIERARDEFNRLCALQREIELQMQKDRIEMIQNSFYSSLDLIAYSETLKNFPLLVPPFVMKNESLPFVPEIPTNSTGTERVSMHCILTNCTDTQFNVKVFPELEERLSEYFCRYWNIGSDHPILFYQGGWKDTTKDARPFISNLKSELATIPTLVISPVITKEDGLQFFFSCWGMGSEQELQDNSIFIPNGLKFKYEPNHNYSDDEKIYVVDELTPSLAAFISFFADQYYWNYYRVSPIFPNLIEINAIGLCNIIKQEYITQYLEMLSSPYNFGVKSIKYANCYDELLYLHSLVNVLEFDSYNDRLYAILNRLCKLRGFEYKESMSLSSLLTKENLFEPEDYKILALLSKSIKIKSTKISKTMDKKKVRMDGNLYSVKRDELLKLLNDTLKLPYLPEDTKREFLRIRKKCLENQYSLILIGEFQGGKSTTFDALCGGREISPRGALTKTSACKITATNLSSNEEEYAEVHWKTSSELILGIQSIFAKRITKEDLGLSENEIFTPSTHLDFKNPRHVQLMRNAIEQEWKFLERNQNAKDYEDQLEIVKIAELILTFFNNPVLVNQSKKARTTIEDVSKLIVFPETWDENWENGKDGAKKFKPEEVLFAFIAKVDCHIHSKQLERLGCSIVDCPGLFASAWDTKVAQETIPEGDAILYLLGGEKQMTDGDKKALREIKSDNPRINNIFFTINQKQNETVTRNFMPKDISALKGLGFNVDNIKIYNALLFFLGQFGIGYLAGGMDNHTIKRFKLIADKFGFSDMSVTDIWVEMVQSVGNAVRDRELKSVVELNNATATLVLERSGQQSLFSEIEEFIVENKAYSILVENGANKAYDAIVSFEERLKQKEEDAQKTAAERQAEFQRRKAIYNQFVSDTKEILEKSFTKNVLAPIVNNAFMFIFQDSETVNRIALKCSVALLPAMRSGDVYMAAIKYKTDKFFDRNNAADKQQQKIKDAIKPIFKNVIEEVLNGKMSTWIGQLKSGKSPDFEMYFMPELERIKDAINQKWANVISVCPELKGYDIDCTTSTLADLPSPNVSLDTTEAIGDFVVADTISDLLRILIGMIANIVTVWVLDGILTGGILIIVGLIVQLVVSFSGGNDDEEKNSREELSKKEQKLYDAIQSNIFSTFADTKFREKVLWGDNGLVNVPNQFVNQYRQYYRIQLSEKANKLGEDIRHAEREFAGAREELERIATEAKQQREMYVHPLTVKINNFIKSVVNG